MFTVADRIVFRAQALVLFLTVAVLFFFGCAQAQNPRSAAIEFAQVSKGVVDHGAKTVKVYGEAMAEKCAPLAGDRAKLDACLGPVLSHPDQSEAAFEAVRSAQIALYLALGADDLDEIVRALRDLQTSVAKVVALVRAVETEKGAK